MNNKPNTYRIPSYLKEPAPQNNNDAILGLVVGFMSALAVWALLASCTWAVLQPNTVLEDFSDSGVGCIDDCLEVVAEVTE